ncbi:MAG: membrane lipoprotein lipid attachment site-containing protein [Bacteroidaceae bacterium]|nr:membrane lipoprotein lipid attachment site-containing protein [Bacteroidaceae bacterium]
MKKFILPIFALLALTACGGSDKKASEADINVEIEETSDSLYDEGPIEITPDVSQEEIEAATAEIEANIEELEELGAEILEEEGIELDESDRRKLKDAAIDAYKRGKDKFQEKMQDFKDSDEYQDAAEKASELKEKVTDKAIEALDDMF